MVLDGESGGLSHIKVSPAHAHESAFAASVADHAVSEQLKAQERRGLQEALDQAEPGAALNVSTPEDGHCLFHALKSGGIFASRPDFNDLDIAALRQVVLSEATTEQREAAAVSNDLPVSVWEQRMAVNDYGDALMISLLSQFFGRDLSPPRVIASDTA